MIGRRIPEATLDKIRKRHEGIETPAMVDVEPEQPEPEPERERVVVVGYAICPQHVPARRAGVAGPAYMRTGLVQGASGPVFREHDKVIGTVPIRCAGSGTEPPERMVEDDQ